MLKIGGAICIMITCSAVGIFLCQKLIDKANHLEKIIAMLDFFSAQISYSKMPVTEIVASMALLDRFDELGFIKRCKARLDEGISFPKAWKDAVNQEKKKSPLDKQDIDRLLALGEYIGTTDAMEQNKTLSLYLKLFSQSYDKARSECTAHSKMYTTLGVLAGIGLVILIL